MNIQSWREKAKKLKTETYALYLALRHPRTPWYARLFLVLVVGYAFSPIDLIPDFIPIIGYLDDLVLIPAGVALSLRMIPGDILGECREKAREEPKGKRPIFWASGAIIILIWLFVLFLFAWLIWKGAK